MGDLAEIYLKLENGDFKVLKLLEKSSKRFRFVPYHYLKRISNLPLSEILYRLNRLNQFGIIRAQHANVKRYGLTMKGYDCLALKSLVDKEIVASIGGILDVGKEADVYMALDPQQTHVVIKFMRIGRTSFRQVKRVRDYARDNAFSWYKLCYLAAHKEYTGLKKLAEAGVKVPSPIFRNRHAVVMESFSGIELGKVTHMVDPEAVLENILDNIKLAFKKVRMIHGDLSEYNVLITEEGDILIIDWAQWVTTKHKNWRELLKRDISNVLKFFNRKFNLKRDPEKTLEEIIKAT
ncbi:MAG: RIO1 family regulatory kinase/ATPase domain-containing protein [Candidatus Odinarchaeia archaeon]